MKNISNDLTIVEYLEGVFPDMPGKEDLILTVRTMHAGSVQPSEWTLRAGLEE